MMIIGVDSSGHVKDPPIYMVAVRKSKTKGQVERTVHVTCQKIETYVNYVDQLKIPDWFGTISAVLIFKAIEEIFYHGDSINIDLDFHGTTRKHVEKCIKKMCLHRFSNDPHRSNPNITFVQARYNEPVREADKKSKKAKYGVLNISSKDPSITLELSWIK